MSSSSYQPLPSDESSKPIVNPPSRFPVRKLFVLAVAFVLVAFASYKAGQWSVPVPKEATTISEKVPSQDGEKLGDQVQQKPSSDNNTMSGKYSVG